MLVTIILAAAVGLCFSERLAAEDVNQLPKPATPSTPAISNAPADSPKPKDVWDKVQAAGTAASAVIVGFLGLLVTHMFTRGQENRAREERTAQASREDAFRQNQLQLTRIQAVQGFMPYLTKTESEKRAAILAIRALGDTELATELARLFASSGTVDALETIAQTERPQSSKPAVEALVAINSTESVDALSRIYGSLYVNINESIFLMSGDSSGETGPPRELRVGAMVTDRRHVIVPTHGLIPRTMRFVTEDVPADEIRSGSAKLDGLAYIKLEDFPRKQEMRPIGFVAPPPNGVVVAIGYDEAGNFAPPAFGVITEVSDEELTVTFRQPLRQVGGSLLVTLSGEAIGVLRPYRRRGYMSRYLRGDLINQFIALQQFPSLR